MGRKKTKESNAPPKSKISTRRQNSEPQTRARNSRSLLKKAVNVGYVRDSEDDATVVGNVHTEELPDNPQCLADNPLQIVKSKRGRKRKIVEANQEKEALLASKRPGRVNNLSLRTNFLRDKSKKPIFVKHWIIRRPFAMNEEKKIEFAIHETYLKGQVPYKSYSGLNESEDWQNDDDEDDEHYEEEFDHESSLDISHDTDLETTMFN